MKTYGKRRDFPKIPRLNGGQRTFRARELLQKPCPHVKVGAPTHGHVDERLGRFSVVGHGYDRYGLMKKLEFTETVV